MSSTKAATVRSDRFQGVQVSEILLSFESLVLDLLASLGSNAAPANPFKNVVAQLEAVASPTSRLAVEHVRQVFDSASQKYEQQ